MTKTLKNTKCATAYGCLIWVFHDTDYLDVALSLNVILNYSIYSSVGKKHQIDNHRPTLTRILFFLLLPAAKSLQSCPTLCDPIDGSPPGSPVPGIPQARTLEWVAISFSNAWKWKVKVKSLSWVWPSATPWTSAFQAPPSMGFSRQEYWSGVPLPSLPSISFYFQSSLTL